MGFTIRDIAAVCGVNASTVSRALRDDPRVKPLTREKIIAIAREHGYAPNILARNLAAGKTNTIWFFLGSLENEIEQKPALSISRLVQEKGYDLMLVLHRGQPEHFLRLLRKLSQKITDGAIVIPPGNVDLNQLKELLAEVRVPVIFIDRWLNGIHCPVVTTDNRYSARTLAEKCHASGAEIFFVYFPEENNVARARKEAACGYLAGHGLPFYDEKTLTAEILESLPGKPLAVLGSSGHIVSSLLTERFGARLAGRPVLGGFFDFWLQPTRDFYHRIFICRQDFDGISRQAADLITGMLSGQDILPDTFIEVPPEKFIEI